MGDKAFGANKFKLAGKLNLNVNEPSGSTIKNVGNLPTGVQQTSIYIPTTKRDHQVGVEGFATRIVNHHSTWIKGVQVDYTHVPTGSSLSVGATNAAFGTDAFARGNLNVVNTPDTTIGINANYSRHYGGHHGRTGKPNYGCGVSLQKKL